MILGIDVGITGCLVVLDDEDNYKYKGHLHMPTIKVGSNTRVNGAAIAAWLHNYDVSHAYIELVNGMPNPKTGQSIGTASAFSFGHAAGSIEGVLQGALIPFSTVTPAKWKRNARLLKRDKDATRSRAVQLYPSVRDLDLIKKGQALGDAIFIARCAVNPL
ncbi:MAG: hypothetical protein I4N51_00955 [Acinetobacter sp.]|nr:hypothetical protein [Acinetobacter sp.]